MHRFAARHKIIARCLALAIVSSIALSFLVFVKTKFIHANEKVLPDNGFQDWDEAVNYEIFPFSEYEKLGKLEEQEQCRAWAGHVSLLLKRLIFQLENSLGQGRDDLSALNELLASPPASEAVSLFEDEEYFSAQCVAEVLKNRIPLWNLVISLQDRKLMSGYPDTLSQMRLEDVGRLYEKSEVIRSSLLASPNGQQWVQFFQLTPLHGELRHTMTARAHVPGGIAEPIEKYARSFNAATSAGAESMGAESMGIVVSDRLSEGEARRISQLVNNIFLMQEYASLTADQARLLETPLIQDWLGELEAWRSDPLHPLDLLAAYECYRQYRGTSDSSRLSTLTRQMLGSKNRELQKFGQVVQNEFSHAHLKVYVSKYLINTMLPKLEPEYGSVNENLAGLLVTGTRRANTQMHVSMIPDPNRLLMSLNFQGQVVTQTTASSFPATLHNQSHGTYSASKQVELTSRGIVTGPANVTANSKVTLNNVETELDFVPVIGSLIQGIAKDQYDNQQQQIQADARAKVVAQAKQRIDNETDARFRELNQQLERTFFSTLRQRQASLVPYEAKTTEEWLHTSWYLDTPYSLGSNTKEPATPPGTIADLKVHELGINAVLERLELAGKQMTLRELKRYLAGMVGQARLDIPEEDHDHVVISFADLNPVGVRFLGNRVELSLNLKRLQVDDRSWNNFCVIVGYVPDVTPEGTPCLALRGTVQLDGRLSLMQQVALRTIFGKIFLQMETIPLRPKLFDNDERFAELATGCIRIENGWFAIALLPQEFPTTVQPKQQPVFLRGTLSPPRPSVIRQPVSRPVTTQARQPGISTRM